MHVFSEHECADIPINCLPRDTLIEQIAPVDAWETEMRARKAVT